MLKRILLGRTLHAASTPFRFPRFFSLHPTKTSIALRRFTLAVVVLVGMMASKGLAQETLCFPDQDCSGSAASTVPPAPPASIDWSNAYLSASSEETPSISSSWADSIDSPPTGGDDTSGGGNGSSPFGGGGSNLVGWVTSYPTHGLFGSRKDWEGGVGYMGTPQQRDAYINNMMMNNALQLLKMAIPGPEGEEEAAAEAYAQSLSGTELRAHLDALLNKKVGYGIWDILPRGVFGQGVRLQQEANQASVEMFRIERDIKTIRMIGRETDKAGNIIGPDTNTLWRAVALQEDRLRGIARQLRGLPDIKPQ